MKIELLVYNIVHAVDEIIKQGTFLTKIDLYIFILFGQIQLVTLE